MLLSKVLIITEICTLLEGTITVVWTYSDVVSVVNFISKIKYYGGELKIFTSHDPDLATAVENAVP